MKFILCICVASLASAAVGKVYRLAVGTFGTPVYTVHFDSDALTLTQIQNLTSPTGGNWVIPNANATVLYGAKHVFNIDGDELVPKNSSGTAGGTFFEALTNTTYYTVGNSFAEAWSLSADGGLESMISNVSFPSPSFTHGIYVGRTEEYAYIPDIDANEIHVLAVAANGTIAYEYSVAAPYSAAGPRHMAFNDAGTYAYVIEQTTSTVDVFAVGQDGNLTYVNQTVTVLPEGLNASSYWADEVAVSDGVLLATTRGRRAGTLGYLYAYGMDSTGLLNGTLLFNVTTPTSGGAANAITVKEGWTALTDSEKGGVYIYKGATVVANLSLTDGSCCTNVAWLD